MDGAVLGGLVGAVGAAVVLLLFAMSRKPVNCPSCGREQPKMRKPATWQQAMWGGYTCEGCGADLDARGRVRAKKS
jgi:transposase-like protein